MGEEWTMAWAQEYGHTLLEGERIRLRALREDDVPQLEAWWNDPAVAVVQNSTIRPRPASGVADMFRSWSANNADYQVGFSVETLDRGRLAGHVGLWGGGPARGATFAIMLGPEYQGKGYGSDAIRVTLRYAFEEMGLHRVQLGVWAYNERAIAVYRKCGFQVEGRRREAIFHGGRFHDEVLMAILEPEWRAATSTS